MSHTRSDHNRPAMESKTHAPENAEVKADVLSNLGGIAVLLILATVVADVAVRQIAGSGILGADTIVSDWWMVAVAMLGIVAAERSGSQIVVDILGDRMSPTIARNIALFAGIVVAIFAAIVAVVSFIEALAQMRLGEYAAVGALPIWPARFLIPIGFGGLAVVAARNVVRTARTAEGPTHDH